MTAQHEAWLGLTREDPIDPAVPIIDPHHHLWDSPDSRYLLDELLQDLGGGHNVVQTVFLECLAMYRKGGPAALRPVGETEFVRGVAAMSASGRYGPCAVAAGIVGFADLTLGRAVAPVLEAHVEAGGGRFRGVRNASGWDPSDEVPNGHTHPPKALLLDPRFREGFACLRELGLSFDVCAYHPQLAEVADLATAFPETTIILNHAGTPIGIGPHAGKRKEVCEDWIRGMAELAACPNVVVKLGGLAMEVCGYGWHRREKPPTSAELAEATAPYYLFCIERFGPDRCMFESNFPVDKVSCSYTVLWNSFQRVAAGFSAAGRAALFHDTAARVYRLRA